MLVLIEKPRTLNEGSGRVTNLNCRGFNTRIGSFAARVTSQRQDEILAMVLLCVIGLIAIADLWILWMKAGGGFLSFCSRDLLLPIALKSAVRMAAIPPWRFRALRGALVVKI